jgi:hypothetical protein
MGFDGGDFAEGGGHHWGFEQLIGGQNGGYIQPELCTAGIAAASRVPEASQGWVEGGVF